MRSRSLAAKRWHTLCIWFAVNMEGVAMPITVKKNSNPVASKKQHPPSYYTLKGLPQPSNDATPKPPQPPAPPTVPPPTVPPPKVPPPKPAKSEKGFTKAKLAQQLAAISAKSQDEPHLGPSIEALCQCLVGGNMLAGRAIHIIRHLWITRKKKFRRCGPKEWLVYRREEWALAFGMTEAQLKNNALPRLKKFVSDCVEIKQMKTHYDGPKKLGIRVDLPLLDEQLKALAGESWDIIKLINKNNQ